MILIAEVKVIVRIYLILTKNMNQYRREAQELDLRCRQKLAVANLQILVCSLEKLILFYDHNFVAGKRMYEKMAAK